MQHNKVPNPLPLYSEMEARRCLCPQAGRLPSKMQSGQGAILICKPCYMVPVGSKASRAAAVPDFPGSTPRTPAPPHRGCPCPFVPRSRCSGRSYSHGSAAHGNLAAGSQRSLQTCHPEHRGGAGWRQILGTLLCYAAHGACRRSRHPPPPPLPVRLSKPPRCHAGCGTTARVSGAASRGGDSATSFDLPRRGVPRACPIDVCLVAGTQDRDSVGTAQQLDPDVP